MWYVYIVECSDKSLYTGITTDIRRRVREHNSRKGGAFTRARVPVRLVYKKSTRTRSSALKREAQIKSLPRREKLTLI